MSLYLGTNLISGNSTNTKLNAHSLFDFKWSDHILNEMSWLLSDTFSWQDGTIYTNVYNHLVADNSSGTSKTETIGSYTISYVEATDGHKITTDETTVANIYAESGVAWYYILDTANQRFKLPRTKFGFEGLRDSVGKYIQAGLPNITGSISSVAYSTQNNGALIIRSLGNYNQSGSSTSLKGATTIELDASNSNSIYGNSSTVQPPATQMYLYFYVGDFSQSATEQTAGITTEQLNEKLDLDAGNATSATVNGLITKADATGKETINGWGIPNYSAGVSISSGYVATSNGFIKVRAYLNSGTAYGYIDGVEVYNWYDDGNSRGTSLIPIKKGSTFTCSSGFEVRVFYPLIGG